MSERDRRGVDKPSKSTTRRVAETAAWIGAAGVAYGLIRVAGITVREHREITHDSIALHPLVRWLIDTNSRSLGIKDPNVWGAIHRLHHRMTDVAPKPHYDIYHAIQAAEKYNQEHPQNSIAIPDEFPHLDKFVDKFTREEVTKIGSLADIQVREVLKGHYKPPEFTDPEKIRDVLNPTEPQYTYPDYTKGQSFTPDQLAQVILTDPHSPALVRMTNGIQGIAVGNVGFYSRDRDAYEQHPEIRPDDLPPHPRSTKSNLPEITAGVLIPSAIVFLARRNFTRRGVVEALAAGAAIDGISAAVAISGGNVINSLGHGGRMEESIAKALLKRGYEIRVKPDGSLTTNNNESGAVRRVAGLLTFDEMNQQFHHAHPEAIAYTDKTGIQKVVEAPWGTFLEFLCDNKYVPFIKRGNNFGGRPRPDVPHPLVLEIQKARRKQLALAA